MDDNNRYPDPSADPPGEGMPDTADPDSHADEQLDEVRVAEGPEPTALPSDRDDRVLALDQYGTTPAEESRDEPLEDRLAREEPDVSIDVPDEEQPLTRAEQEYVEEGPVPPRLDSHISVYDRPLRGVPGDNRVGHLVQPDEGAHEDTESTEIAYDTGASRGESAEEVAIHRLPPDREPGPDTDADTELDPPAEADGEQAGPQASAEDGPGNAPAAERRGQGRFRTGAEQPWDPEDLAVAEGRDPTPRNIERARRELEELGRAAIEKTVP